MTNTTETRPDTYKTGFLETGDKNNRKYSKWLKKCLYQEKIQCRETKQMTLKCTIKWNSHVTRTVDRRIVKIARRQKHHWAQEV